MRTRLITIALALLLLVSAVANLRQNQLISSLKLQPASVASDQPYIKKAAAYWGQKSGSTADKAMIDRYGKVIFLAGKVCVSLEIESGGVGGVPVYCFDERSGQLKDRYDDVE